MNDAICYSGTLTKRRALGSPHYSYRFAEEKFLACFAAMGIAAHFLAMPEYYGSQRAYETLPAFAGRHVHVIFRSTEQIRLLKCAYNILAFAWEFPHLKDTTVDGEHPFSNQKRMLALCDEIWVPCTFTKRVLERHGLSNVFHIPAPIEPLGRARTGKAEALSRIGHLDAKTFEVNFVGRGQRRGDVFDPLFYLLRDAVADGQRHIYLSIFNPEDFRKNFDAMVRGFDAFQQRHTGAMLVIKALTSRDRFGLDSVVLDVMTNKLSSGSSFANNNIIVINQFLDDDEMAALFDLADFYLCTSIAEGQNLPLLEAMTRGIVPVTTRNTAMSDYIGENNAVIVETTTRLNDNPHLAGNVAGKAYDVDLCDSRQVRAALERSAQLDAASYAEMSHAATLTVERQFSIAAVRRRITDRLAGGSPPQANELPVSAVKPGGHGASHSRQEPQVPSPRPPVRHIASRG